MVCGSKFAYVLNNVFNIIPFSCSGVKDKNFMLHYEVRSIFFNIFIVKDFYDTAKLKELDSVPTPSVLPLTFYHLYVKADLVIILLLRKET